MGGDNILQPKIPLLPATYRSRHAIRSVNADINGFLGVELDVARLNCIHRWLWLVGLPTTPRPLHYQTVKKRDIVVTEQLDLHLVWSSVSSPSIFIKPLPRFLLCPAFWRAHICPQPHLYQTALGFLLSYVALIERETDLNMALRIGLVPPEITWPGWLQLVEEIVHVSSQARSYLVDASPASSTTSLEPRAPVNPRFYYGELRLGRLNWIYRLVLGRPRGYLSGCTTYGNFMRENVNSLITLFAYTTIVLSAMQVGLSTSFLQGDYAFGMASYVFSVFAILAPLACIMVIILVISMMFFINLIRTVKIRRKRRRQGAGV